MHYWKRKKNIKKSSTATQCLFHFVESFGRLYNINDTVSIWMLDVWKIQFKFTMDLEQNIKTTQQYTEHQETKFLVVYIMLFINIFITCVCSYFLLKILHVKSNHSLLIRPEVLPLDYGVFATQLSLAQKLFWRE